MPTFQYTGRDKQGQAVNGNLEANSADAVANQLLNTGITPLNIDQEKIEEESTGINFDFSKNKKPTLDDLVLFSRQMYTLMHAGVPIIRSITGLAETTRNQVLQNTLHEVRREIEAGHELSSALAQHPDTFSHLFVSMVQVGENTGNLDDVFLQISGYLEREKNTRDQIKAAIRYPMFVIIAITIAMFIINMFVIPTFAKVFAGFGAELPLPTRILLSISEFTVNYWYLIAGLLVAAIFSFRYYIKTEKGHWQWDRALTRFPIIGSIVLRATLARFARSFSMALSAGVPLVTGLTLVSRAVDNIFIGGHVADMRNGVERGDSLTRTAAATGMFTPLIIQMLTVGEETGNVDDMLEEVANFYDREVDYDVKNLTSAIEPILIVFIGGMVLVLALGVFLPMWDLASAAKGRALYKNSKSMNQRGFTLLELVIVIIVISILGLFAIDRVFAIRIAAEQASIKQLVGTIKSALGLKVAELALDGNMLAVAKLDQTNPLLLLSQSPVNYIGEKDDSDKVIEPGVWYFNKKQNALIYNIRYAEGFKTKLKGLPRIRHRIKLIYNDRNKNKRFDVRYDSIAGLDLVPIEKYIWNIKPNSI